MRKLKYVKLFESFQVNEIFGMFGNKEKKGVSINDDRTKTLEFCKNPDKFRIVEVGSPEYKSYEDIKEGDFFIDKNCVELLEMGKKDLALREWTIFKVEAVLSSSIKIEYIFLNGRDFTNSDGRFATQRAYNYHLYFTHKIIMK